MTNYRNPKLLELAKEAPHCMFCKVPNHGQVVAHHSLKLEHGHGTSIKAHDVPAYLCDQCHAAAHRLIPREVGPEYIWLMGVYNSFHWLLESGHLEVK